MNKNLEETNRERPRKKNGEYLSHVEYERICYSLDEKEKQAIELESLKKKLLTFNELEEKIKILVRIKTKGKRKGGTRIRKRR